ncbi:MAG: thiamine pyrophosphate-binding protein, partial [Thermaerobacterales bacterium]
MEADPIQRFASIPARRAEKAPTMIDAPANGGQAVVAAMFAQGVETIFGIPGGAVLPLYDELYAAPFQHVLVRHEQAAVLAADGYARASGKVGVCIATSGPGATNLVTGLATAFMDSVPIVAITGNVPRAVLGTDGFQEADTFGFTLPVTKHSYIVTDPDEVYDTVKEAFVIAAHGRQGPVLIDIPKDVFTAPLTSPPKGSSRRRPRIHVIPDPAAAAIETAAEHISRSRRPVLYAGGGIISSGAHAELRQLAEITGIPVTTTLMGLGSFPGDHRLFLGMPGMHGTYAANHALSDTDCLIAVGTRFDDRVTGKVAAFASEATVIHIDIDASE